MHTKIQRKRSEEGALGKKLAIAAGVVVLLLAVAYFVVTSSAFFKGVILPRVAKSMNAEITVADASINPFKKVELTKLVVKTTGTEPLLTAESVRVRYSLMDIIGGDINVDEMTLNRPVVNVITEADGRSNLDPLLKDDGAEGDEDEPSDDERTKISIKNVSLQNATVRQVTKEKDGSVATTELKNLNLSVDQLGNEQSGNMKLGADLTLATTRPQGTNDVLQGRMDGTFAVALTKDLLPSSLKGQSKLQVTGTQGGYEQVNGLVASLDCDLTPTELKEVALKFAKGTQPLGQVRAYGPLDLNTKEGRVHVEVASLDKNILNFAGVGKGWDFRDSTISTTNQIDISQKGSFVAVAGRLNGNRISIAQENQVTPEINLLVDYQGSANLNDNTALLQKLNVSGIQQGSEFLRASLDREMNLSWGEEIKGFKEAALNLVLTNFNLAQWRPVIGTNVTAGVMNLGAVVQAQKDGKLLNLDLNGRIQNLALNVETNSIREALVTIGAKGTVQDMNVVNLTSYNFGLARGGEQVVTANGSLRYELESSDAQVQTTAEVGLPRFLEIYPMEGVRASSGIVKISAALSDLASAKKQKMTGNIGLERFTGEYDGYLFTNFNVGLDLNSEIDGDMLNLHHATATFSENFQKGGSLDAKGKYDTAKGSGDFEFKAVELNERVFRPVLASSLGENQLVSMVVNAAGIAHVDPNESSIKSEVKISNWVVQDKEGKLPKAPQEVSLKLDGSKKGDLVDLRELLVKMTPTRRAQNELRVQAKIDLAPTNATPGHITVRSESFDVTPYYDMFAGTTSTNDAGVGANQAPATASATAPAAETEPEPMSLPSLTADLKLDRFFLREIAISNWNGTVAIQSNVVTIKPFELTLNGGPVSVGGTVDVGQPGYRYNLTFNAQNVPLEPVMNSLDTNSAGAVKGTFFSQSSISGAGTTGSSIQKNLQGKVAFNITNMNYQILGPRMRKIMVPISAVLRAPELLQTPVNWVSAKTQIGSGTVQVQDVAVESEAFFAKAQGTIQLAAILTNSTLNIPLELHLRRSLAEKSKLLPPNTPAEAKYAVLPSFVTVKGTLGEPSPDINELALLKLGTIGAANIGDFKEAGAVLKGLDLISGSGSGSTNASGTNQTGVGNLLRGLGNVLGGNQGQTNAPAASTNAPASTNQPKKLSPLDLLRGLQGGDKQ